MSATESRRDRYRRIVVEVSREVFTEAIRFDRNRDPTPEILDGLLEKARCCADEMDLPPGFDESSDAEIAAGFRAALVRKFAATRAS